MASKSILVPYRPIVLAPTQMHRIWSVTYERHTPFARSNQKRLPVPNWHVRKNLPTPAMRNDITANSMNKIDPSICVAFVKWNFHEKQRYELICSNTPAIIRTGVVTVRWAFWIDGIVADMNSTTIGRRQKRRHPKKNIVAPNVNWILINGHYWCDIDAPLIGPLAIFVTVRSCPKLIWKFMWPYTQRRDRFLNAP